MADNIVRLKVDSTEYDSKVKRAADGILALERSIRNAGESFIQTWKDEQDFAKALGEMETKSKTASGRIGELRSALTEMSVVYKRMTDEEKASPFGQNLGLSLDKLKSRLKEEETTLADVRRELGETGREASGTGGVLDQLAGKFGLSVGQMTKFGAGLAAAKAALDVAKDAFFASEATVDEWGRITESAQSVYEGFLNAINNGDISGYLTRIDQIVEAARKAYNELDTLGTMKTIQGPAMSKQEAENNRMRMMIMTGRYIAPTDGTPSAPGLKNGDLLSKEQIQNIERHLQNGMQTIVKLTKNELDQTGRAIDAYYEKLAKQNGMSVEEFRRGTSSWDAFQERLSGARELSKWEADHLQYNSLSRKYELTAPVPQELEKYRGWDTFRVDKMGTNSFNDLVNLIKQQQQQTQQLYSTIGQAYRTINRAEGVTVRGLMGSGSGSGGGVKVPSISSKYRQGVGIEVTESMASLQAKMRRAQSDRAGAANIMDFQSAQQRIDELRKQIDAQPLALSLGWSVDKAAEFKDSLTDSINKMVEELDIQPIPISLGFDENGNNLDEKAAQRSEKVIKDLTKTSNAAATATQGAATATNNLGAALASLDDPGAKAAGTVMQAIASIALGFAQAAAAADTTASGWGWLAWLGAGTAALATTIATVHSLTNFSEGGMVPGNSYSGDNQHYTYGLNAGEVVLNKAQQSNLAGQLDSPAAVAAARPSYVRGKDIFLGVNNYLKESGRGQLVTSR